MAISYKFIYKNSIFWNLQLQQHCSLPKVFFKYVFCAIKISLYYTILHYTILYDTILYYTILYYTILYYTILYYTILYYTILYYTILYYTILYYTILYYAMLCCTILNCTILYYTKGLMQYNLFLNCMRSRNLLMLCLNNIHMRSLKVFARHAENILAKRRTKLLI